MVFRKLRSDINGGVCSVSANRGQRSCRVDCISYDNDTRGWSRIHVSGCGIVFVGARHPWLPQVDRRFVFERESGIENSYVDMVLMRDCAVLRDLRIERCDVAHVLGRVPEIQTTEASDDRPGNYRNGMTVSERWKRDTASKSQCEEEDQE